MGSLTTEILLILVLVVANGVFAMAEVAIVASRKARLQGRAQAGDARARVALELVESPNRFLATVQVGITLIGIFAGAFGGATLSKQLAGALRGVPTLAPYADSIGLGLVVMAITYLSLIVGELVPKRIGMHSPETIASLVAVPMRALSILASPLVSFLSFSTDLAFRLLGLGKSETPPVSEEEINVLMEQGRQAGIFAEAEQSIVGRVFRLGDRTTSALMTPRPDIAWLDADAPWPENAARLRDNAYSRMPVCRGELDEVVGIARAKDLLNAYLRGEQPDLMSGTLQTPVFVPETLPAFKLMEAFRLNRTHLILVIDERGTVQGLVTLHDILGAIVGDLPALDESDEPYALQRDDGSWLLDGMLPIEEFKEIFALEELPGQEVGYQTLGGFVMLHMGRIPAVTESFEQDGLRFEILSMDGNRIDKITVARVTQ